MQKLMGIEKNFFSLFVGVAYFLQVYHLNFARLDEDVNRFGPFMMANHGASFPLINVEPFTE